HVLEVLHMAALVGAHRNALRVFLKRGGHDLVHRAVVAEMDDLGAHAHEDAPHDVDRGVVPVEQRGRGDEAQLVGRAVRGKRLEVSGQVGHGVSGNLVARRDSDGAAHGWLVATGQAAQLTYTSTRANGSEIAAWTTRKRTLRIDAGSRAS